MFHIFRIVSAKTEIQCELLWRQQHILYRLHNCSYNHCTYCDSARNTVPSIQEKTLHISYLLPIGSLTSAIQYSNLEVQCFNACRRPWGSCSFSVWHHQRQDDTCCLGQLCCVTFKVECGILLLDISCFILYGILLKNSF